MLLGQDPLAARRYTTVVGNASAVRCQQDCLAIWHKELQRGVLTDMDQARLCTADPMRLAHDRSQSFSGSSWVARLEDPLFALVLDLPMSERRVSASVLRWPEEEDYVCRAPRVWGEALKGPGTFTCDPRPSMVALKPPFLTRKYSTSWYFLDALTQASIKGFWHSIPYMMYTS
eukprot:contig_7743_g1818